MCLDGTVRLIISAADGKAVRSSDVGDCVICRVDSNGKSDISNEACEDRCPNIARDCIS